jgi:hypothetical protein
MPSPKGNKNARRAGTESNSTKGFRISLTPKEHAAWTELARALKVSVTNMARDAVREKRERMIAAGLKLGR